MAGVSESIQLLLFKWFLVLFPSPLSLKITNRVRLYGGRRILSPDRSSKGDHPDAMFSIFSLHAKR